MLKKNIFAGSIGTFAEWAEFSFYGYMIIQISHLFFPMLTAGMAMIAGFGTFAVSYLARPLGSILFGYIGDTIGRQKALSTSILFMSVVTLCIGLLPTYNVIGFLAPVLLILFRFLQGLAVSGEFTGAAIMIIEQNPEKPHFASSWINTAAATAKFTGGLASIAVSLPFMPTWGWRIPFCLGFLACFIGFYIRRNLSETMQFQELQKKNQIENAPIKTVFRKYKMPLFQIASIGAFIGIFTYTCDLWWVSYVIQEKYFSGLQAKTLATVMQGSVIVFTPLMGILADRCNGKNVMRFGILGNVVLTPLLFFASAHHSFPTILTISLFYGASQGALSASMFKYFADIFPASIRYTGQAIGWNIALAIFGGTTPIIAQILFANNLLYVLIGYVMFAGVIALIINSPKLSLRNNLEPASQ